jgi:hypothetical protein
VCSKNAGYEVHFDLAEQEFSNEKVVSTHLTVYDHLVKSAKIQTI